MSLAVFMGTASIAMCMPETSRIDLADPRWINDAVVVSLLGSPCARISFSESTTAVQFEEDAIKLFINSYPKVHVRSDEVM